MSEVQSNRDKAIKYIKYLLFSASIVPCLVAGAITFSNESFTLAHFLLVLVALFVGQMGGDYLYYHFTKNHSSKDDAHTKIFKGWRPLFISFFPVKNGGLFAGLLCILIDILIGVYFYQLLGDMVLYFAALGFLLTVFFTPLMYLGLKELVVFITFGPLCISSVYYVLAHTFSYQAIAVSLPIGFLVTVVAYLKGAKFNMKIVNGQQKIVKLNKPLVYVLSMLTYISILLLVYIGYLSTYCLTSFITIPLALSVVRVIKDQSSEIEDYLWATVRSILNLLITGAIISIASIL